MGDREKILVNRIKRELVGREENMLTPNVDINYSNIVYKANIKVKTVTKIDNHELIELFDEKELWEKYSEPTLRDDAVEEAWLAGDLTDDDLRRIRKTDYQLALKVDEVDV